MEQIIRTSQSYEDGMNLYYVFGLNTLSWNRVRPSLSDDPIISFLQELSSMETCSVHTGNIFDLAHSPSEMFGHLAAKGRQVKTGINGGVFFDAETWKTFPALYFPIVENDFWHIQTLDGDDDIRDIIRLDAIAVYVGVTPQDEDKMIKLLNSSFPESNEFLKKMVEICKMIITSKGDGQYFEVYAKDKRDFDLLTSPISEAREAIKRSSWYIENVERLVWDDESLCLELTSKAAT